MSQETTTETQNSLPLQEQKKEADQQQLTDDIVLPKDLDLEITKMHIKTLVDTINKLLDGRPLDKSNIFHVTYACIRLAKKMKDSRGKPLKGVLKKKAVVTAIATVLKNTADLSNDDYNLLIMITDDLISSAIDVIVSADAQGRCCIIT